MQDTLVACNENDLSIITYVISLLEYLFVKIGI